MGWMAILVVALAGWLIWTGRLQRMTARDGMALGVAIVGALLAARGKPLLGALPLLASTAFFVWRSAGGTPPRNRTKPPVTGPAADLAEARALLGLTIDADADAIRSAHRRLIASVHPDRGGTEALAAKINAARDILLRHRAEQEPPRPD
ncbi:molecular chaperone DnaJ [Sphingobium sp. AN641]|uniref:J domain-containing protein n=1 Tax=Sphingobium sp. AN641 TaxID=3133443 RepID=UPI0030C21D61